MHMEKSNCWNIITRSF